jgi:hypothetical protein
MTQFHKGQEVEVATLSAGDRPLRVWHKAKITSLAPYPKWEGDPERTIESYFVEFPDGMRDVFDADNIREKIIGYAKTGVVDCQRWEMKTDPHKPFRDEGHGGSDDDLTVG